ncbi:unnamed protein product [Malus baccata var. baccata]
MSSQKQNLEGMVGAQNGQYRATAESSRGCGGGLGRDHEAFWKLTGFGFRRNSEVKREGGQSIPRMGDLLGSSARVSTQKQNHEGVVGPQSRQYRATVELSPGCGEPCVEM